MKSEAASGLCFALNRETQTVNTPDNGLGKIRFRRHP